MLQHLRGFLLAERQQQDRRALGAAAAFFGCLVFVHDRSLFVLATQVLHHLRDALRILADQRARLRELLFVGERRAA